MTLPDRKFQRLKEDFVCEKCGFAARGNGYTNHCPKCLWSKHVDVNPGDRVCACEGPMEPISAEIKKGENIILHQCERCGFKKKNKASKEDDFETILKLLSQT